MSARSLPSPGDPDATLPASAPAAQRLGKYTLTDKLGEGAMGVVYRARDPHIDRVVAIKTIRKALLESPTENLSAALRFRNEARAAGRLSHPGIVAIHEYGEDGDENFIVMEYVEGASLLRCTLPTHRLPMADALSVMAQLLHALSYAHAHGVWHRDIKPSNLIVTAGGRLKVTDFGIARIDAAALTQDASVMGSTGYMAPECYREVALDQRVDLFACGVVLYELLSGQRLFAGQPGAVMHRLLHDEVLSLAASARDPSEAAAFAPFEAIVARATARDREQRYASAQEMLDALTQAAGHPIAARVSVAATQRLMAKPDPRAAAQVHWLPCRPAPEAAANVQPPQAPQSLPVSGPGPASAGFDATALATLESLLVPTLGPIARVVVKRTAARSHGLVALVARLANEVLPQDERRGFIAQAESALRVPASPASSQGGPRAGASWAPPVLGCTPLHDESVQRCERLLAHHIGPIARVMVRRAREQADSREQFIVLLADQAAACVDRERLLAELEAAR